MWELRYDLDHKERIHDAQHKVNTNINVLLLSPTTSILLCMIVTSKSKASDIVMKLRLLKI